LEILRRNLPPHDEPIEPSMPLSDLGLTSIGMVGIVMELEDALDVSIPDELVVVETFASADTLWNAVAGLGTWAVATNEQ
jgi:acyl carrier protein